MDTNKLLATLCAGLLLAGCGEWKQNPLDGKKGNFGQGKPVPTKPDLTKPLESGSVRIYVPDFHSFEEGRKAEFSISARVLVEDYTAEVEVVNLADFPGATYNQADGSFSWTPPLGYVESTGENGVIVQKTLRVRAYGYKPGDQVLVGEQERPLYISREFKAPQIMSVTKPEAWLREGSTMLIPVVVLDKDAVAGDRATWPKLVLQAVAGSKSLSGLTTIYRDESLGSGEYRTFLQVDLREVELSDSIDVFKVGMVAFSRFGKSSLPVELTLDVYTSFATPTTTWDEPVTAVAGQALTHKFLITDPKLEAWLNLDRTFNLPEGSALNCVQSARGMLVCTFTWTPAEAQVGSREISVHIKSRNHDTRDILRPTRTLYFSTLVLPQGS